jgi:hypothetical protein
MVVNLRIVNMAIFVLWSSEYDTVSKWQRIAYVSEEGAAAVGISSDYGQPCKHFLIS